MRTIFSAKKKVSIVPEPIDIGGTGASTAQNALAALNGIPITQLDQIGGVAVLDSNLLVKPANIPAVEANIKPTILTKSNTFGTNETIEFLISNYDSRKTYTLTAISGTVELHTYNDLITALELRGVHNYPFDYPMDSSAPFNGLYKAGTIIYTAPDTPGPGGFIINGENYPITILEHLPPKANILNPLPNTVININNVTVEGYAAADALYGDYIEMEFELAEDSNFTLNLVNAVVQNDNFYTFHNLIENKLYYIRIRANYQKSISVVENGLWSNTVSFATATEFQLVNVQTLFDNNPREYVRFGSSISMTADAKFLAIGSPNDYASDLGSGSSGGSVSIFKRAIIDDVGNNIYKDLYYETHEILGGVNSQLGEQVCISNDGIYLFVSKPVYGGEIHVYKATTVNPVTWTDATLVLTLTAVTVTPDGWFGVKMAISKKVNGFIYIVAADEVNGVFVYKFDTSTDTISDSYTLVYPTIATNPYPSFGSSLSINNNGDRILVGATYGEVEYDNGNPIKCGLACLYQRTGNTWSLIHTFEPSNNLLQSGFGNVVGMNNIGDEVYIADYYIQEGNLHLYIFNELNSNWNLTQRSDVNTLVLRGNVDILYITSIVKSDDNLKLFIGVNGYPHGEGEVFALIKSNNEYITETNYLSSVSYINSPNRNFGCSIAISQDSRTLACGSEYGDRNTGTSEGNIVSTGNVEIFE